MFLGNTSFQIEVKSTFGDESKTVSLTNLDDILENKGLEPYKRSYILLGNKTILVSFARQMNDTERNTIENLENDFSVQDYNECKFGQQCYGGTKCKNVQWSFECVCEGNAKFKDGKCLKTGEFYEFFNQKKIFYKGMVFKEQILQGFCI